MKKRMGLAAVLVSFVFFVMFSSLLIIGLSMRLMEVMGIIDRNDISISFLSYVLMLVGVAIGTAITALLSRWMLKPVRNLIEAVDNVAKGDFTVRVNGSNIPELETLAVSFNKMARKLEGIELLRTDFVNNFSHEFKTPIVSIKGFVRILQDETLTAEERREYLDIIIQESERLAELSTNVLNLSKIETVEIINEKKIYALDEQIRLAILMLEPKWSAKNLTMEVDLESINIYNNAHLLQHIWVNLLDNAIKFTDSGEIIQVSLTRVGLSIRFCIRDNGQGMDEETMQRIFDKFYQGDASRSMTGNGLGLTLVKKIIDLTGGSIEVDSSSGKGSVFTILLPSGMSEE
ncbi:signal transduction histidine kinase [Clostridium aceticum]|uniref:histidine kinase n=1 Tax=Clostridium aceticum TaxID=84022 RepID=A0A0D8I8F4_9CLOT|nr:HAMP domain-containing sensor histidine kinase [Clostridium aceticum]AKL96126.1 signal transduction histidine kinase [Clostridium aceticum]KJF25511.1 histidine kinase [Clostridium aceticum]